MATASIIELLDGVVEALNAPAAQAEFSQTFTAVRVFNPQWNGIEAKNLTVVVTDSGGDVDILAKKQIGMDDAVRVVILHRVNGAGTTGIDDAKVCADLLLLEEVLLFLVQRSIASYSQNGDVVRGTGEKDKSHYMPGNLTEDQLFGASLTFGYRTKVKAE